MDVTRQVQLERELDKGCVPSFDLASLPYAHVVFRCTLRNMPFVRSSSSLDAPALPAFPGRLL